MGMFLGDSIRVNSVKTFRTDMTFLPKSGDVDLERRVRYDLAFLFRRARSNVSCEYSRSFRKFGDSWLRQTTWNFNLRRRTEIKSLGLPSLRATDMEYGNCYTLR